MKYWKFCESYCKEEVKSQSVLEVPPSRGMRKSMCHRELKRVIASMERCQSVLISVIAQFPLLTLMGSLGGEPLTEFSVNPV